MDRPTSAEPNIRQCEGCKLFFPRTVKFNGLYVCATCYCEAIKLIEPNTKKDGQQ